jgi:choline monooxygenase
MSLLLSDAEVIDRIFSHIDGKSTDHGNEVWHEPTEHYRSPERFEAEIKLMRRLPVPFCPSAALPENGSYIARTAAGTPLVVVRGDDGVVRAFRNACRHRGMAVAKDSGCTRAFVCPYHAWAYGLDGKLKHVSDEDAFPGLDKDQHGLVPVTAEERGGLVFITQDDPVSQGALEQLPDFFTPEQQMFDSSEFTDEANWKLIGETSMEGYHIKHLHNRSFYPYGFDNLNVVQTYGPNSRIVFPFRRVEKLRDIPREERRIKGMVTDVMQIFPNTHVTALSNHSLLIILDPVAPTRTNWIIYRMTHSNEDGSPVDLEEAKRDAGFVMDTGLVEDREAATSIQTGLNTNANEHFTFGHAEQAIVHFHSNMQSLLDQMEAQST